MTLDDLIALCDELAALSRAGVPLDQGLKTLAHELPGKLGRTVGKLGAQLERGQDLDAYLRAHEQEFPPAFAAVVEAGLRAGHLPAALEDLARSARRMAVFRRSLLAAWIYPLVIFSVAWGLFVFAVTTTNPVLIAAYDDIVTPGHPLLQFLTWMQKTSHWWRRLVPLLIVLYFAWAWWASRRADPSGNALRWWSFGVAGPVLRLRRAAQLAGFTDLLALLVEHLVPLPEALHLAAKTNRWGGLAPAAERLAAAIERGQVTDMAWAGCPPLLNWLLVHPPHAGELAPALRLLANEYEADVERQTTQMTWYGPLVLTALLGGSVTALNCVAVAGPWLAVLYAYVQQALS